MNIREISDIFKDSADNITAIKSYNFGWASDRVRQGNTEDFQELNEFPRIFFAVPTITGSDQTRKQDTYQVTIFFDDLLGYDNEGDEDPTLQIDKWANLQQYANYFVQRLNKIKQSILPNYLFIPEAPSITFDSFTGIQRMITVQLSFNVVVPTNCDPGIITLVQCIANIVTSSNLTASLTTVLKFAASLEGRATVTADINFVQKVASSLNASALLSGDISFVQKAQASLLATGTTTANLTVGSDFDADAAAFFDRVTAAGGTLTATEQTAVNTLVLAMKSFGIWTKMKAIYPMVGGGQANPAAACAQNLKSASFTGTFSSGWTFASAGVKGNGTSALINTFFKNSDFQNYESSSVFYYGNVGVRSTAWDTGNISAVPNLRMTVPPSSTKVFFQFNSANITEVTYSPRNGFFGMNRISNSQVNLFANNTKLITVNETIIANLNTNNIVIGEQFSAGSLNFSDRLFKFYSLGSGLTDTEASNFYTAVQAFQTTLNRQV